MCKSSSATESLRYRLDVAYLHCVIRMESNFQDYNQGILPENNTSGYFNYSLSA